MSGLSDDEILRRGYRQIPTSNYGLMARTLFENGEYAAAKKRQESREFQEKLNKMNEPMKIFTLKNPEPAYKNTIPKFELPEVKPFKFGNF